MGLLEKVRELKDVIGDPAAFGDKVQNAAGTVRRLLDGKMRRERLQRLYDIGETDVIPTDFQLVLGAYDMMMQYILPSNVEFYEHYEKGHWWHQLLRIVDEPSTMLDPIGIGLDRDMQIRHLLQIMHASAGYDVALLRMFEDGLDELERNLELVIRGEHPNQKAIETTIERRDYHAILLDAVRAYRADPKANWRVDTVEAPEGCEERFDWGIETFGSPGRLFAYASQKPPTLKAWLAEQAAAHFVGSAPSWSN